ncbi:MAG: hypothetical protein U1A23_02295, partial [Candidatus Sungbacteria bacterium]|nr:hypothetical protein [Candidatus Sungbacteria bacterium]
RLRRSKNYEAYTAYMLNNFSEAAAEIWKLQQKNLYAVGLLFLSYSPKRRRSRERAPVKKREREAARTMKSNSQPGGR